ncbi:hypothetical protein J1N35_026492 [Gossypium stocksii]|uniref:Uncharacterized protein n=1 Tax=Gossypium stocksii TaxID=47602 RepID=A0A9D3ZYU8_9ROSI|nr:hypothetical protein J1N35_026492 [Gossypium stocksii]
MTVANQLRCYGEIDVCPCRNFLPVNASHQHPFHVGISRKFSRLTICEQHMDITNTGFQLGAGQAMVLARRGNLLRNRSLRGTKVSKPPSPSRSSSRIFAHRENIHRH